MGFVFKRIFVLSVILFLTQPYYVHAQANQHSGRGLQEWILEGSTDFVEGLGVADYSRFNPEKSWKEALENAVTDLNSNHSLIVSHYGYRIGSGPLRIRSNFAIRTFLDSTQVAVIDSARWRGRAFIRVKPKTALSDSLLYPNRKFRPVEQGGTVDTANVDNSQWLLSTGSTPSINSNWYMSATKAKQDALRKLAESLAVKVTSETHSKGDMSMGFYSFSTLFAFQRIRVLKREFGSDSTRVQVAVSPWEVKKMMD